MNKTTITMIGGDSRQLYSAEYLANQGYKVNVYACELGIKPDNVNFIYRDDISDTDIIVLPLPVTKNGKSINSPLSSEIITMKEISDSVNEKHCVFLGMAQPSFMKQLEAKAKYVCDYFTIESLTYKNALLTAEGILGIILAKLPVTVFGLKTAVTGYGRIGYFISGLLKKMGADVTVFARNKNQLTKALTEGLKTGDLINIKTEIADYDCIINTVPATVINSEAVKNSKEDALFIESASAPYGIDFEACANYNRNLVKAFSLPGKTSPKSAGIIIAKTVEEYIRR